MIKPHAKNKDKVRQFLKDNPNIKPTEVQSTCIMSVFCKQSDWEKVEKQVKVTLDKKWISNEKQKMKKDIKPVRHNFEAVVTFKEYCDKKDQYYVYKINDR